MNESKAEKAMRDARALARADSRGIGQVGIDRGDGRLDLLVTWTTATQTYDVGDAARSYATGKRSVVLPVLEKAIAPEAAAPSGVGRSPDAHMGASAE